MASSRYRFAIGLNYNEEKDGAPTVGVTGDHLCADEIVRVARRFGVPVVEKGEVATVLSKVELDAEIPTEIYQAIAIILREIESITKR